VRASLEVRGKRTTASGSEVYWLFGGGGGGERALPDWGGGAVGAKLCGRRESDAAGGRSGV